MNGTEPAPAPQSMKPPAPTPLSGKRRTWLIVTPLLIFGLIAIYMAWDNLYGASAKKRAMEREDQAQTERYHAYLKTFEDAMRTDTYGGTTPEETLELFIAALTAGDIDLASKYFMIETNEERSGYLTRERWETRLAELKKRNLFQKMVQDIETMAKPDPEQSITPQYYGFVLKTEKGLVGATISMEFNKYSGVWKITGM